MIIAFSAELLPPAHCSVWLSSFTAYGILGVFPLILSVLFLRRALLYRRLARDSSTMSPNLALGPAVLTGVVEVLGDDESVVPVRVEVIDDGSEVETAPGRWVHNWTEIRRSTTARVFNLRLRSGERVRVEPATDVVVQSCEFSVQTVDWRTRAQTVTLSEGMTIQAIGQLRCDYVASTLWNLEKPALGRVVLSSEPVGRSLRAFSQELMMMAAGAFNLIWIAVLLNFGYHTLQLRGVNESAVVVGLDVDESDDGETNHYISLKRSSGDVVRLPTDSAALGAVKLGDTTSLVYDPRDPSRQQVGSAPTLNVWFPRGAVLMLLLGLGFYCALPLRESRLFTGTRAPARQVGRLPLVGRTGDEGDEIVQARRSAERGCRRAAIAGFAKSGFDLLPLAFISIADLLDWRAGLVFVTIGASYATLRGSRVAAFLLLLAIMLGASPLLGLVIPMALTPLCVGGIVGSLALYQIKNGERPEWQLPRWAWGVITTITLIGLVVAASMEMRDVWRFFAK